MRFLHPQFLWLLPLFGGLAAVLWAWGTREFHRRTALFVAAPARDVFLREGGLRRQRIRLLLGLTALVALALALARPLAGLKSGTAQRHGVTVLLALDASKSMLVQDVPAASRFDLAQSGVQSLVQAFEGDRAGLMLFGGQATLVSPVTFDTVSLQVIARDLTTELVGRGGSSLEGAIRRAMAAFHDKPYKNKVLVVFTDGEETDGDALLAAQEAYTKEGIRIYTIGVGSVAGGVIPAFERNDQREWVRVGTVQDESGQDIRSRLDPKLLADVAAVGGGTYVNLAEAKGSLKEFYAQQLLPLAGPLDDIDLKDLREWFQPLLAIAFLCLVAEMLLPRSRPVPSSGGGPGGSTVVLGLLLLLGLTSGVPAHGAVRDAQRLLDKQQYGEAFSALQKNLLAAPEDPFARYNYAVGAYASGKFTVAIDTFEKLLASYEPEIANQSAFQLGNSFYRQGEAMRRGNPEGTIPFWEKALNAYAKTPLESAKLNRTKVHGELLGLVREVAGAKERGGDEAARTAAKDGIPLWREAMGYLDKAAHLEPAPADADAIAARKAAVGGKIYDAYTSAAVDQLRSADRQHDVALERAITFALGAGKDYDAALELRPGDEAATKGKAGVAARLEPWMVELGDQQHAAGLESRKISLEDAFGWWRKAAASYTDALSRNPANAGALAGQQKNNRALHDGYVELGDRKQEQAADTRLEAKEQDRLLLEALGHYEAALAIEPDNAATKEKLQGVGRKLTTMFVTRGFEELAEAKRLADDEKLELQKRIPLAIAWAERSVQSFRKALRFDAAHERALAGRKEAEELLKKLRQLDNSEQRKVLAKSAEMKNPEDLKDQGKLALKLLEYDKNKLSSKKQQNLSVPENKPLKDW